MSPMRRHRVRPTAVTAAACAFMVLATACSGTQAETSDESTSSMTGLDCPEDALNIGVGADVARGATPRAIAQTWAQENVTPSAKVVSAGESEATVRSFYVESAGARVALVRLVSDASSSWMIDAVTRCS